MSEELKRRAALEEVGGAAALASLVEEAATAAHLLSYGAIVREKALLRDLIRIATEIIGQSYEARDDVDKLLDDAERLIFQISERRMQGTAIPVRSILKGTFEQIEKLRPQRHIRARHRLDDLDRILGIQPSASPHRGRPSWARPPRADSPILRGSRHKRVLG